MRGRRADGGEQRLLRRAVQIIRRFALLVERVGRRIDADRHVHHEPDVVGRRRRREQPPESGDQSFPLVADVATVSER